MILRKDIIENRIEKLNGLMEVKANAVGAAMKQFSDKFQKGDVASLGFQFLHLLYQSF